MESEIEQSLRLDRQLCFPLYTAARLVTGSYAPHLKPLGLTYTQYVVFLVLWEEDGLTVGEIGDRLRLDSGTLTPLLKRLEAEGYVRRARGERDERVVRVFLTAEGMALREKCAGVPERVGRCVRLSPAEAAQLYTLLHKVIDGYEK